MSHLVRDAAIRAALNQSARYGLGSLLKTLILGGLVLYVIWGTAWFFVTPPGLREMPLWIAFAALTGVVYLFTLPISAIFDINAFETVMIAIKTQLENVGLWELIMNFGQGI